MVSTALAETGCEQEESRMLRNIRSGAQYTTWTKQSEDEDGRASLTEVGNKITISPLDSFAFTPEIGYGKFNDLRTEFLGVELLFLTNLMHSLSVLD